MKTNQIMSVEFTNGVLHIGHLDMMGKLDEVFMLGNVYRYNSNLPTLRMESWLAMESTKEYVALVSSKLGRPAKITRKGKGGGTSVHLRVIIDAAMYLSAEFKDEVIQAFIEGKILRYRDEGGDKFIDLNAQLAAHAEQVLGKAAHSGHFIHIAKTLKAKLLPDGHPGWNYATPEQLSSRIEIEDKIGTMLRLGLVRDWEHLKTIIERI